MAMRRAARAVYIAGQGQVPVTRNAGATLSDMGATAIDAALVDAGMEKDQPTGLFVGNMMSGILSQQQHLGPYIAYAAGLGFIESSTVEGCTPVHSLTPVEEDSEEDYPLVSIRVACCGAGGAALRAGYMAIASGLHDTVLVTGVEAMTHAENDAVTRALATASHWRTEGSAGMTFISLNAGLMERYMEKYSVEHRQFAPYPMAAHKNASTNPNAVFQNKGLTTEAFEAAPMLTTPVQLFDACPTCDGAATVVLTANKDAARRGDGSVIRIAGSGAATDVLPVRERANPLHLTAVELSTEQALWQAELSRDDLDIFELHDAYGIMACLSLESAGFTPAGTGLDYAAAGNIDLTGATPIATFGGLKARGHPVGATGVYQAAETFLQLTRNAGLNQVEGASTALVQNIGGAGSSVFTHALVRE